MDHPPRRVIDVDYRWIDAIPLENLESGNTWICKMVCQKGWHRQYLMIKRDYWTEDDYFKEIENLFLKLNIDP